MDRSPTYFDPRTLARLAGLELRARHIVEGFVAGAHRSPFHGFSIEFAQHREYTPGDDLRYLDWKVFARTDKFYLKQFEEETNLVCQLVLDVSESMSYRGPESALSKLEYAQCLAAALAYLVVRQQDSVGLTTFADGIVEQLRPGSQAAHWKHMLGLMEKNVAAGKTGMGALLADLAERLSRRSLVILLSDLFADPQEILAGLARLRHRGHDVVVLHVLDPAEREFPFRRTTLFHGLEGSGDLVTDAAALRRRYLAELDAFLARVKTGCRAEEVDYFLTLSDRPIDAALTEYLTGRARRVRH